MSPSLLKQYANTVAHIGESTFYVDFVAEVQGNCNAPAVLIYVCYTEAEADGNLGTFSITIDLS